MVPVEVPAGVDAPNRIYYSDPGAAHPTVPTWRADCGAVCPSISCPVPAPGEAFFVGEAWFETTGREEQTIALHRAAGGNPGGRFRWSQARHMPEWAARSRFEVVSRAAVRVGDIGARAERSGLLFAENRWCYERSGAGRFGHVNLAIRCNSAVQALAAMWESWHRQPFAGWCWVVEVKSA